MSAAVSADTPPPTRRRRRGLALATAAVSLLVGLSAGEIAMRRLYGEGFGVRLDRYEDHPYRPYLRYTAAWGKATYPVYTNSLGWRDARPDHRIARSPRGRTRIVFLGDSFTEGLGFRQEQSSSGVAAALLGPRYEVLNGGRNSYCPLLEYQRLRRFLEEGYQTGAVVLLPDPSDAVDELIYGSRYELAADGEPLHFREPFYGPLTRAVYNSSALARSLRLLQQRLAGAGAEGAAPAGSPPSPFPVTAVMTVPQLLALSAAQDRVLRGSWMDHPPSLRGWAAQGLGSLLANVGRIDRLCAERSIPLLVVLYPWPSMVYTREDPALWERLARTSPDLWKGREALLGRRPAAAVSIYQTRLRELCRSRGIPCLDLIPVFQGAPDWPRLYIPDDVHFSAEGNRLAGTRIAAALRRVLAERRP